HARAGLGLRLPVCVGAHAAQRRRPHAVLPQTRLAQISPIFKIKSCLPICSNVFQYKSIRKPCYTLASSFFFNKDTVFELLNRALSRTLLCWRADWAACE